MNYRLSSSILKLWLDGLFSLLLILLLYYFLVKVHQFRRPGSWHSPPVRRISSLINRLAVCFLVSSCSFCVCSSVGFVFSSVFLIVSVYGAHSVYPVDSVLFFPFWHSVPFSCIVGLDFFAVIKGEMFEVFEFRFELFVFVFEFV